MQIRSRVIEKGTVPVVFGLFLIFWPKLWTKLFLVDLSNKQQSVLFVAVHTS